MESHAGLTPKASQKQKPIKSWSVIDKPAPFGDPDKRFRIEVTYKTGTVRVLAVAFRNRTELDRYVDRFHPEFAGKEH
jgi:hypothetical protein